MAKFHQSEQPSIYYELLHDGYTDLVLALCEQALEKNFELEQTYRKTVRETIPFVSEALELRDENRHLRQIFQSQLKGRVQRLNECL